MAVFCLLVELQRKWFVINWPTPSSFQGVHFGIHQKVWLVGCSTNTFVINKLINELMTHTFQIFRSP